MVQVDRVRLNRVKAQERAKAFREAAERIEGKVQRHIAKLPSSREIWFATQAVIDGEIIATSSHPYYVQQRRIDALAVTTTEEEEE